MVGVFLSAVVCMCSMCASNSVFVSISDTCSTEGPVDDGSAAAVSSAEDGASGAVEHALPIKISFKASKPADASSGDGEVTAANDEGEEEASPATSAAAADTDAGEAVAVGGEAAVDSDDDDGDAVAESKSRKRKIVRDDSDDDDDDDNNTRNDDDE